MTEVRQTVEWLDLHASLLSRPAAGETVTPEMAELVAVLQPTLAMLVVVGRWGEREQQETLKDALDRVVDASSKQDFGLRWTGYGAYATYLLLYAAGIAALSGERFEMLSALLAEPTTEHLDPSRRMPLTWVLSTESYSSLGDRLRQAEPAPRVYTPLSDRLRDHLLPQFAALIPQATRFDDYFDRFEYLLALVYMDLARQQGDNGRWAPVGRFSCRADYGNDYSIMSQVDREVGTHQGSWPPLRAGFFGGDLDRLNQVRSKLNEFIGVVQSKRLW